MGDNPWAEITNQSLSNLNTSLAAQASIPEAEYKMQAKASSYPAMTNTYGIGMNQATPAPSYQPPTQIKPQTQPDASSRGYNPWSLQGEALSR